MSLGEPLVSTPLFRLLIKGILPGFSDELVREQLQRYKNLSPQQVQQLLDNQAPLSQELLEHRHAFRVQTRLRELGVDCVIEPVAASAPAPENQLDGGRDALLGPRQTRLPRPVSGTGISLWPVLVVALLVLVVSLVFQSSKGGNSGAESPQVAALISVRPFH